MNDFRWGILGTGKIARAFAEDLAFLGNHRVASVGSRSVSKAQAFADSFEGCVAYGSYEELVASDVDAIYVASPHPMHFENSMLAMKAGKPVLCEKAFTVNAKEARALVEYSQAHRIPLMEAMWTRFLPHIQEIKSLIASGALGVVHTVIADHGQYIPYSKAPRLWEPELGGGALLDLGIYPITIADIVFGAPKEVHAHATLTDLGVDLQTSMGFTYENGAHAILTCTMANRSAITAVITGDKARIEMDGYFFAPTTWRLITRDGEVTSHAKNYEGGGLREEAKEFARIVQAGEIESPLMPHAKTIEIMELMDQVREQIGVRYPNE